MRKCSNMLLSNAFCCTYINTDSTQVTQQSKYKDDKDLYGKNGYILEPKKCDGV